MGKKFGGHEGTGGDVFNCRGCRGCATFGEGVGGGSASTRDDCQGC